jgi:hypothetical protein
MTRPSRFGPAACARIVWANPRLAKFISERRLAPMRRMMAALDARERAALIKALGLFADEIERGAS